MRGLSRTNLLLNQDYRDILFAFSEEDVRYLLVGAYAMAAYGQVRATGDIDLWVESSRENAQKVMDALRAFGVPLHDISQEDFERPNVVFRIGVAPRRIDILTGIDAVGFSEAWRENRGSRFRHLNSGYRAVAVDQEQARHRRNEGSR